MKKLLVILLSLVIAQLVFAGEDATNVVFRNLYPSDWASGGVTTKTIAVEFDTPSWAINPRLQSAPSLSGTGWRSFYSGEVVGIKMSTAEFPWTITYHLDPDQIGTEERWFRVVYNE